MKVVHIRPLLLTLICILGYVWVVFTIPSIFSPATKRLGEWYPALFGAVVAAQFISLIGVWHMKRWGVELFLVNFFFKTLLHAISGMISDGGVIFGIILSVFFSVFFLVHYRTMDRNL